MSLTLSPPDGPDDAAHDAALRRVAALAAEADGYRPFNEQALLDIAAARRTPILLREDGRVVGAAITAPDELDLVIAPEHRRRGLATEALTTLLSGTGTHLSAWSHGDHPGARALAARYGFSAVRTLLQLRLDPLPDHSRPAPGTKPLGRIDAFRPATDDAEWVALNALVFSGHPEQGSLTHDDLAARRAEPWFDPGDFLIARDPSGRMMGYNWLKLDPGEPGTGEIYAIGVHPDAAGQGLGRRLMSAGLARLAENGCTAASLYVEADNTPAVRLYRSLGFTDHTIDVQYRKEAA
ncbi:MAG: mycothiol synthase [Cryobacterium sp.]|nr:mycothiol synthase [Cryobacterium sp.]